MRCFSFLIFVLMLSACHKSSLNQIPDYEKMADRVTAATARKIEQETGMRLAGVGGGAIDHIRKLNMAFICYREIMMEQGRELVIYCVNEYLTAINADEEIRPHLIHYPFTPKDIEIEIFIYKTDHRDVPIGALSVVSEVGGQVVYKIRQPDPIVLKRIHEETFEEAVKVLAAENPIDK